MAPYISLNRFPTLSCLTDLNDAARSLSVKDRASCSLILSNLWSSDSHLESGEGVGTVTFVVWLIVLIYTQRELGWKADAA